MREIKFRAWDSKQKKYIDEVYPQEYMFESNDWDSPDYGDMCEALSFFPKSPMGPTFNGRIIYEQFSGLKDKNGKDIYEGDILENKESTQKIIAEGHWEADDFERGVVYYDSELARFGLKFYSKHGGEGYTGREQHIDMYVSNGDTVIGNIHENPELLK